MNNSTTLADAKTACVTVGGVRLQAGMYLPSNSSSPVQKKPDKKEGYAHFDGETLTLRNYRYMGAGTRAGNVSVGLDLSSANTELVFRGENVIEIVGQEKSAALLINDGELSIRGKGSLALYARGGRLANFAMLGNGHVDISSGTVRLRAETGEYTVGDEGQRIYLADSYATKLGKLTAKLARVRGDSRVEDENGEKSGLELLNRNNETEVIIDFPKIIFWWWRKGCLLPLLLMLLALGAILVGGWSLLFRLPEIVEPDFNMIEVDEDAEKIDDDDGDSVESASGGGAVVLNFSYDVIVDLSDKKAALYFGLPGQSNKDAVLQLIVGDVLLAQSGRLPPGYQITSLTVPSSAADELDPGSYSGMLRVLYYDDETGERAILDTEIQVTVTVIQ